MQVTDQPPPRVTPRATGRCPRCGHTFEDCTCGRSHHDDPARTRPPRPSVTSRARGNQRWRLIMRIDSARATLRAAGGVAA